MADQGTQARDTQASLVAGLVLQGVALGLWAMTVAVVVLIVVSWMVTLNSGSVQLSLRFLVAVVPLAAGAAVVQTRATMLLARGR